MNDVTAEQDGMEVAHEVLISVALCQAGWLARFETSVVVVASVDMRK